MGVAGLKAGADDRNASACQSRSVCSPTVCQHAADKLTDCISSSEADQTGGEVRDSGTGSWVYVFAADVVAGIKNPCRKEDVATGSSQGFKV
jgi:hypothetical protein